MGLKLAAAVSLFHHRFNVHLYFCTKTIWTFYAHSLGVNDAHIKASSSYPPHTNSAIFSSVNMPRIRPPDGSNVCGTAWEIFILTFASLLLSGCFCRRVLLVRGDCTCMLHAGCWMPGPGCKCCIRRIVGSQHVPAATNNRAGDPQNIYKGFFPKKIVYVNVLL